MPRSKGGYYAVRKGRKCGVYQNWKECETQVKGFPGCEHKRFNSLSEAEKYLESRSTLSEKDKKGSPSDSKNILKVDVPSFTSFMGNKEEEVVHVYAVRRGHSTGLFYSWEDCKCQTEGYPDALFGKFENLTEAKAFLVQPFSSPTIMKGLQSEEDDVQAAVDSIPPPPPPPPPSKDPINLSEEQYKGLKRILDGHSVFLSGSAGTGKSFLVQVLSDIYRSQGKIGLLAITASTGCAACGINGQTIHAWAGVGTGLGSNLTAEDLNMKLGKLNRKNWQTVKLLLIDEISMISATEFQKLSDLAGIVLNKPHLPFGGLQVVLCGDFLQLPPVSKHGPASFCFESDVWKKGLFPDYLHENIIVLSKIQRQKEKVFQRILESIRMGIVTPEVDWFLKRKSVHQTSLVTSETCCEGVTSKASPWFTDRSLGGVSSKSVKLYSRVSDVARVNAVYLDSLPSKKIVTIKAEDSIVAEHELDSSSSRLCRLDHEVPAHKTLDLKIGAQVMLIANLDTSVGLVNGARGRVVNFVGSWDNEIGKVVLPVVRFVIESSAHSSADLENSCKQRVMATRLSEDNRGYKLFSSMGYNAWNGLGKHCQGSPDPVPSPLINQCSIGLSSCVVNATAERTLEFYPFHLKSSSEKILATRRQVPLILAHAITIHKTQGMSIPDVDVNMNGIFTSGQAYVALSRARSAEGLKVTGYNKKLVFANTAAVRFYGEIRRNSNDDHNNPRTVPRAGVLTSIYDLCTQIPANSYLKAHS